MEKKRKERGKLSFHLDRDAIEKRGRKVKKGTMGPIRIFTSPKKQKKKRGEGEEWFEKTNKQKSD